MSSEGTDFLYPFIEAGERDSQTLLADLASSAAAKASLSDQLGAATLEAYREELGRIGDAMAERFQAGGRLFAFGNGGSSTDAACLVSLFADPPSGRSLPALSLAADEAVVTALGNDVGFDLVFSRQIIAYSHPGDVAVAYSTSGSSENVILGVGEARRRGLLTVGLSGYEGGRMAACPELDHCLVVRSDSVHRIQEAQAFVSFALWGLVQERLRAEALP